MRLRRDRNVGWPCLTVDNVAAAATYFRDVLGFEQLALIGGVPPKLAVFRGYGATLLLQEGVDGGGRAKPEQPGPPWQAVLLVRDVEAAHRELTERGAIGIGELSMTVGWRYFEFEDTCGNRIGVGHMPERFLRQLGTPRNRPFAALRARLQDARTKKEESEHLREFQAFHEKLEDKDNVFYMFFTTGLLHWVLNAESFVPPEVNLVLIGSALTPDEDQWIRENVDRPFHHIRLASDDITVWDFLIATNKRNFGWLDIDCFVLNSRLFDEITELPADRSMNCTWAWDSGYGFPIAGTHFLFVNVDAIAAVAAHGVRATACTFDWDGSWRGFRPRNCYMKVPTAAERKLLLKVLPPDGKGRPRLLPLGSYYDTLVVLQLFARAIGYPINQVRTLVRRCAGTLSELDETSTDPQLWPEDLSDELFHLFGISYYKVYDYGEYIPAVYLAAELAMLDGTAERLPAYYAEHRDEIAAELASSGTAPEEAKALFKQYLVVNRGLPEPTANRIARIVPAPARL